jgi:diguanylate cyclase (GGDEF)-like protein
VLSDFVIEDCNSRGASMARESKKTLIGKKLSELPLLQDLHTAFPKFRQAMETGFCEDEFKVNDIDPALPTWVHRRLVRSGAGLAVTLRDISDTKENEQLLVKSANTDPLTGLPNRYWLINSLPGVLKEARNRTTSLAILFIDLDNFKLVNDKLGHAIGDKLLRLAAERLKSLIRTGDEVVRLGGDEFTVLLKSVEHANEVIHVVTRIAQFFAEPFNVANHTLFIGTSIGISLFPEDGTEADVLIQKADIAMYASKAEGKGTYRFYNEELYQRIRSRLDAEEELAVAIEQKQFEMHYQPRVNTLTGEITGLEALVRWAHPTRGTVSPCAFIPMAESTGSIVQLGALILEKVFDQIAQWRIAGEPIVPVSINISPRQLDAGGVDILIKSLLLRHDIPASMIEVELTESAMMSEVPTVIDQVSAIRSFGIKLHLDDFGTGYSSLSRLQEIDMQVVKVDRAFISKLGTSNQADILVRTIVQMAKGLNMEVIAEGVETREQLNLLKGMACDEVQGYLLSRPVSANAVVLLLRQQFLFGAEEVI